MKTNWDYIKEVYHDIDKYPTSVWGRKLESEIIIQIGRGVRSPVYMNIRARSRNDRI